MTNSEIIIDCASLQDLDQIMSLMLENQPEKGGNLSAKFERSYIEHLIRIRPIIIARRQLHVIAFLMSSDFNHNKNIPIIDKMLSVYHNHAQAYLYGPICVKEEERGQGIAQAMFEELRIHEPSRQGILFIKKDNNASLRAHKKMGMNQVAHFNFEKTEYVVLT